MSKASRRQNALMRHDMSFRHLATKAIKERFKERRYGHVFSEAAHYLNRAAEYRLMGQLSTARRYVNAARSILLQGTRWWNVENQDRIKLP